jgi:tRNA dimethylallyltransferase
MQTQTLYFIVGCTASGKGSLGGELARRVGGQIISVDSMKIYRRMDIGTAKPSAEVREAIGHHCIDLVEPSESFSVARYVDEADRAVEHIRSAGAIPLAVGGTSLYIKALCEGLFDGPAADPALRERLMARAASEGSSKLHAELQWRDPEAAGRIHPNDIKRIVRALEVYENTGEPISSLQTQWEVVSRYRTVRIGIRRDREDQNRRINLRAKKMMEAGLADEVRALLDESAGLSPQAAQAVGYAELIDHFAGKCSLDEAFERIKINTRRLAKKQRTWQRRWGDVHWFDAEADEPVEQIADRVMAEVAFE